MNSSEHQQSNVLMCLLSFVPLWSPMIRKSLALVFQFCLFHILRPAPTNAVPPTFELELIASSYARKPSKNPAPKPTPVMPATHAAVCRFLCRVSVFTDPRRIGIGVPAWLTTILLGSTRMSL